MDPDQPIFEMSTGEEQYAAFFSAPRFYAYVMGVFAVTAALLGAIGLYGALSSGIATRTREFGLRLALGAAPTGLQRMVLREGLSLLLVGAVLGVGASFYATRLIESLLAGVTRADPVSYAGVLLLTLLTALAACWLPARRASATDPAVTLRAEG